MILSKKEIIEKHIAELTQRLPVLDGTLDRILVPPGPSAIDREDWLDLLKHDPGLCVQFLALANSTCFGAKASHLDTVEQAWDSIDAEPLRVLIGTSLMTEDTRTKFTTQKPWRDYVHHSQTISAACVVLAGILGLEEKDKNMYAVAGLSHDIGRVIMLAAAQPENAVLLGTSPERMAQVIKDEQTAFGLNHCHIGWELFHKWNFPAVMQQGVLRHHTPLINQDFSKPGAIVFIAHFVTMSDFTGEIIANMLGPALLECLGIGCRELVDAQRLCMETYKA